MNGKGTGSSLILGLCMLAGLGLLGYFIREGVVAFRALDRTVVVKGLSEREMAADIAIWPIRFSDANNDLVALYSSIQNKNEVIKQFLKNHGFTDAEIFVSMPMVTDRAAEYSAEVGKVLRYSGTSTVTVYTRNVDQAVATMQKLVELGKLGIALTGGDYSSSPSFIFTRVNEVKPGMVEEATQKAREVAQKFAADSKSKLGRIKHASQGQFEIMDRDESTPYIKKVRIVSTIEYYLAD